MSERRVYRFVGGPWHNDRHEMDGRSRWLVPVIEPVTAVSILAEGDTLNTPGIRCAVYERQGDYPAEWFYRFTGWERR